MVDVDYLTRLSEWAARERGKLLDSDVEKALEAGIPCKDLCLISDPLQCGLALAIHHGDDFPPTQVGPMRKIEMQTTDGNYKLVVS